MGITGGGLDVMQEHTNWRLYLANFLMCTAVSRTAMHLLIGNTAAASGYDM